MVLTILKDMKVNGKDDIPYMKWKIKFMLETTNQLKIMEYNGYIYIYTVYDRRKFRSQTSDNMDR